MPYTTNDNQLSLGCELKLTAAGNMLVLLGVL